MWPGFAINTVFYAAILWLPFAPFQLRRYLRRKRGLCIKCGYDLRGDFAAGCPECGWGREADRELTRRASLSLTRCGSRGRVQIHDSERWATPPNSRYLPAPPRSAAADREQTLK